MKINKFEVRPDWRLFWLKVKDSFRNVWWTFVDAVGLVYLRHEFDNGDKMIVIGPFKIEWTP